MATNNWLRSFCAAPLNAGIRTALSDCISNLRSAPLNATWTLPEQLHVTLTFHGDRPPESLRVLSDVLRKNLVRQKTFEIEIKGLGHFGRPNAPRVIWAGIDGGRLQLSQLQECIALGACQAGIEPEQRPYHPHVTLGRIRHADQQGRKALLHHMKAFAHRSFGRLLIEHVVLVRSEITSHGARHSVLQNFELGKDQADQPSTTAMPR